MTPTSPKDRRPARHEPHPTLSAITVDQIPSDDLRPDPANPRRITEEELEALTRAMRRYGLVHPILARREDSTVIGGHQRLVAADAYGYDPLGDCDPSLPRMYRTIYDVVRRLAPRKMIMIGATGSRLGHNDALRAACGRAGTASGAAAAGHDSRAPSTSTWT